MSKQRANSANCQNVELIPVQRDPKPLIPTSVHLEQSPAAPRILQRPLREPLPHLQFSGGFSSARRRGGAGGAGGAGGPGGANPDAERDVEQLDHGAPEYALLRGSGVREAHLQYSGKSFMLIFFFERLKCQAYWRHLSLLSISASQLLS